MSNNWILLHIIYSCKKELGQDLAEYALLIGLIAIIVVVALGAIGTQISDIFQYLGTYLLGITTP